MQWGWAVGRWTARLTSVFIFIIQNLVEVYFWDWALPISWSWCTSWLINFVKLLELGPDLYHCVTQTTPRRPQCQNSDVNEQLVTNGIKRGLLYLKGRWKYLIQLLCSFSKLLWVWVLPPGLPPTFQRESHVHFPSDADIARVWDVSTTQGL